MKWTGGGKCGKGTQLGLKPWAAVARTQPLYVALYRQSSYGGLHLAFSAISSVDVIITNLIRVVARKI